MSWENPKNPGHHVTATNATTSPEITSPTLITELLYVQLLRLGKADNSQKIVKNSREELYANRTLTCRGGGHVSGFSCA